VSKPAADSDSARVEWIRAGQDLLREHGARGLKIHALAERRGATTGSFYHHFDSFQAYLDELADYYSTVDPQEVYALVADWPPADRLRALFEIAQQQDIQPLDHAMRMWAATNARAEAAVRKLDQDFLLFLRQLFLDLGLSQDAAQTRAVLAFSANVAIIYPPWEITDADAERAIGFLTTPPGTGSDGR
jgi:AcrR family transcriptional regulator